MGKDPSKGARGTSAKNDDVDIVWQLSRGDASLTLRCTHQRVRWVPEIVNLAIAGEPHLHHQPAARSWAGGTVEAAEKLDQAVPLNAGRPAARDALKTAGIKCSTDALRDALRWRRERPHEQMGLA